MCSDTMVGLTPGDGWGETRGDAVAGDDLAGTFGGCTGPSSTGVGDPLPSLSVAICWACLKRSGRLPLCEPCCDLMRVSVVSWSVLDRLLSWLSDSKRPTASLLPWSAANWYHLRASGMLLLTWMPISY